ncbi:MAG: hypothetical protein LBD81_00035 [Holosporaceae bacterium]|jgi:hypothetical protein|nr:hypothetical protein [Holosporaceae bacterium]
MKKKICVLSIASLLLALSPLSGMQQSDSLTLPSTNCYIRVKKAVSNWTSALASLKDNLRRESINVVHAAGNSVDDEASFPDSDIFANSKDTLVRRMRAEGKTSAAESTLRNFSQAFMACRNIVDADNGSGVSGSGSVSSSSPDRRGSGTSSLSDSMTQLPSEDDYNSLVIDICAMSAGQYGVLTGNEQHCVSLKNAVIDGYNYACQHALHTTDYAPATLVEGKLPDLDSYSAAVDMLSSSLKGDSVAQQKLANIAAAYQTAKRFVESKNEADMSSSSKRSPEFFIPDDSSTSSYKKFMAQPRDTRSDNKRICDALTSGASQLQFDGLYEYPKVPTISSYANTIPGGAIVIAAYEYAFDAINKNYLCGTLMNNQADTSNSGVRVLFVIQRYDTAAEYMTDAAQKNTKMMLRPHRMYANPDSPEWSGNVSFSMKTFSQPSENGGGLQASRLVHYSSSQFTVHTYNENNQLVMSNMYPGKPAYILSPPDSNTGVNEICPYTKDQWRIAITRIVGPDSVVVYAITVLVPDTVRSSRNEAPLSLMPKGLLSFLGDIFNKDIKFLTK